MPGHTCQVEVFELLQCDTCVHVVWILWLKNSFDLLVSRRPPEVGMFGDSRSRAIKERLLFIQVIFENTDIVTVYKNGGSQGAGTGGFKTTPPVLFPKP